MSQIKIEITFDPATETVEQALAALRSNISKTDTTALTNKAPKKDLDKVEPEAPAATAEATPAEATTEKPISKTDIRATATALSKTNKPALKAIFDSFGVVKLSDIPEDKYPELMRKMVEANA